MQPNDLLARGVDLLGLDVPPEAYPPLLWYLGEMRRWNRRINLTAITDPSEGVEKHLLDALTPLCLLQGVGNILDLGSGAGLPGIALKIAKPPLHVVSVEAVGKKATFQRHVARTLGLKGFEVWGDRAEALGGEEAMVGAFSAIISRAFASLHDFAALALPCLAPEGHLIAMKGGEGAQEARREGAELQRLGIEVLEIRQFHLPFSGASRSLVILGRPR